jgi:hypothetical protein
LPRTADVGSAIDNGYEHDARKEGLQL